MRAIEITLPGLSALGPEPLLQGKVYENRIARLRARMAELGLAIVVAYADREHAAVASYLTGFDPRFEEALVVVGLEGPPAVVAGNESLSLVGEAPIELVGVLCQAFSLPGQDRAIRRRIADALAETGMDASGPVGVVGWKPVAHADAPAAGALPLAVPAFVLDELRAWAAGPVVDATAVVSGLDGLRAVSEADQLALNEHRATRASQHVWRAVEALRPGISELELSAAMRLTGSPLSCHVMCTSGTGSVNGLRSPTDRTISEGDLLSTAVGLWGGLTSRAGRVVDATNVDVEGVVATFLGPYVSAVAAWYGGLRIGASAGALAEQTTAQLAASGIRPLLNPGHLIAIDEWAHSPFVPGSDRRLTSGMALQCDVIPVTDDPRLAANMEDSLALADAELRAELSERFAELWERVTARRAFMTDTLGFELPEEVLPFSDRPAALPPALLSPQVVVAQA